jgi:hypothetical protein
MFFSNHSDNRFFPIRLYDAFTQIMYTKTAEDFEPLLFVQYY